MPRDLETICLKCLEKDPDKRYQTSGDLHADLQAFLDGRPVKARPLGTIGKLSRWARRKPVVAALSAAVIAGTIGGVVAILSLWQLSEANFLALQEKDLARQAEEESRNAQVLAEQKAREAKKGEVHAQQNEASALQIAEDARDKAEASFQLARKTLFRFLTQVPNSEFLGKPGLEPVKRDLRILGREYYLKLLEARPDDMQVKFELSLARFFLAMTFEDMGQIAEAADEYQAAAALIDEQLKANPESVKNQRNLAACLGNLANLQISLGRRSDGISTYRKIQVMQQKLVDTNPDDSRSEVHLVMTLQNLGSLELEDDQIKSAEATLTRAREIGRRLQASHADDLTVKEVVANCDHLIGRIHLTANRLDSAQTEFDSSADSLREILELQPDNVRVHEQISEVMANLARLQFERGNEQECEAAWKISLQHNRIAHAKAPQIATFRLHLAKRLAARSHHRCEWGQLEEAIADLTESRQLFPKNADRSYSEAKALADFVVVMDTKRDQFSPKSLAMRDIVVSRAFAWLMEAINLGYHNVAAVKQDESWIRLKDRPEYQTMIEMF